MIVSFKTEDTAIYEMNFLLSARLHIHKIVYYLFLKFEVIIQ